MKHPLISVVIPCYNYASYLPRAVSSVVSQQKADVELIIVNDGSTDNTKEVIADLENQYPDKIRALHKKNGGLSSARNFGIDSSQGDYIIFLDADDELMPDALEHLRTNLQENITTKMVLGSHTTAFPDGKRRQHIQTYMPEMPRERVRAYLLNKKISAASSYAAIHRDVFSAYRYNEKLRNAEDIPMFSFILANYECTLEPKFSALMYQHDGSLRHNLTHARSTGAALVEEVFEPSRMPYQELKVAYSVQRYLSLFRTFYLAGDFPSALEYYRLAIRQDFRAIGKISYARKALSSWIKVLLNKAFSTK